MALADVIATCRQLRLRPPSHETDQQARAAEYLRARCVDVFGSRPMPGMRALENSLRAAAEQDPSTLYGRLLLLSKGRGLSGARLDSGDLPTIDAALQSDDMQLSRMAVALVAAVVADGSPDDWLRILALRWAFWSLEAQRAEPRSRFDEAADCVHLGACADDGASSAGWGLRAPVFASPRENGEFNRLAALYADALRRRSSAAELLSVR